MKKILLAILCVAVIIMSQASVLADVTKPTAPGYDENLVGTDIKNTTKNVWATVAVIVQILCVGCVVFAGLRYMFASADQKADIKQGLIYLAAGAFIVFGAVSIIQLVTGAANSIIEK